jgi:predicted phage tail protein
MTNVYLYGILGKIFGKHLKIYVASGNCAINAIECNRPGFLKKIYSLAKKEYHYLIMIDGELVENKNSFLEKRKITQINIIPCIAGNGFVGGMVAGALGLAAGSIGSVIVSTLVSSLVSVALSVGMSMIMKNINKQSEPPQQAAAAERISVGGMASAVSSAGKSYIFSNPNNHASQGSAIPIGFGKMRVASSLIFSSVKNYDTNFNFSEAIVIKQGELIY